MRLIDIGIPAILLVTALVGTATAAPVASNLSPAEAEAIATEAYIYGYPLITMDMTRQVMTNVASPTDMRAPMGQFVNARTYPNASFRDVTAPNADTLYSSAWLDLGKEPYILHVPDEAGRYYLMPMLSGWTDVFADPGKRTTGTEAGDFALTGPGWTGTLPAGVKELKSPTNMVWVLGRTYSTGTPEDYAAVHAIQNQYSLTPLSYHGASYIPPKGKVDPKIDMKTPVRDQVNKLDAATFFKKLALLMRDNPPAVADASMVAKMAKIGIVPGQNFDMNGMDPKVVKVFKNVPPRALEKILGHQQDAGKIDNGWIVTTKTGLYGTDYLQRALTAVVGLGANRPQDAVYPMTELDGEGQPLDGANKYTIHFPKGQTPPAEEFWSLTMYDDHYFFVANPLNRYTVSPRNQLKYNPDGSLDLYIQNSSPGKDHEANWLPAPIGKFILMLRLYWPKEAFLNGSWKPPAVTKSK